MDPFAPPEMIKRLTQRKYKPAQCRALERMGIAYTKAADGEPLVLLRNLPHHTNRDRRHGEPRLDLLGEKET